MLRVGVFSLLFLLSSAVYSVTAQEGCGELPLGSWTNDEVIVEVHRNGDPEPCGSFQLSSKDISTFTDSPNGKCLSDFSKFEIESYLTYMVSEKLDSESCLNLDDDEPIPGFLGYCDRGETYTPILLDHPKLVRVPSGSLPCRFFTREGLQISSISDFTSLAMEKEQICEDGQTDCGRVAHIHIYAVSAGRVFMFAPSHVGEIFELPHVDVASGLPVYLEVLNTNPRVFEIFNFFDRGESDSLVTKALAETSESHRIKRSTTGTGENTVFEKRTSESGFDTHGATAQKVKRRCMKALGFDEYSEGFTDGLQILRYNATKAYTAHMDYMTDKSKKDRHDYDSQFKGANRFATVLLYMSDMEPGEGGETLFSMSYPPALPEADRLDVGEAIKELRASGDGTLLKEGSWQEKMVATCRSKFSVRPRAAKAVLFYSQLPNGKEDPMSMHGGCPVLLPDKPKWAANLWVWNAPREGFEGSPVRAGMERKKGAPLPKQLKATFTNTGTDPVFKEAELYYDESGYWGKIGHGDTPLISYTYPGHKWNIKVDGKFVKQFITGDDNEQEFNI